MAEKKLGNIAFELNEQEYVLGFGIEQVEQLSNYSVAKKGELNDEDVLRLALAKYSKAGFISDKKIKDIRESLLGGLDTADGDHLTYEEIFGWLFILFAQTIDEAAQETEPAIIEYNKDNTVNVTVGADNYKLMFTRENVNDVLRRGVFEINSVLDLYAAGSMIVKAGLEHYDKKFSVRRHEQIFLSIWAAGTEEVAEVINSLIFHAKEVVGSATKKSSAALKAKIK